MMQEKRFEELVQEAIKDLPFFKRLLVNVVRRRRPDEFYAMLAAHCGDDCPLADAPKLFAAAQSGVEVRDATFAVDPENLQKIIDFLKFLIETLLPLLLPLLGL